MFLFMVNATAPMIAYGIIHSLGLSAPPPILPIHSIFIFCPHRFKSTMDNSFFAFTHVVTRGRQFVPIELFSLAVNLFLLHRVRILT